MSVQKANTIREIHNAVLQQPLEMDELDRFYCDTDSVRSPLSARLDLKMMIEDNAASGRNAHYLFVGYRGCGKSTELNHLQKELKDSYAILNYSVMKELDPQSLEYIELFIVTMQRLFEMAKKMELGIDDDFIDQIVSWTQTKEIEQIKDKHLSAEVQAGLSTKVGLPYLLEFFAKLKGAAKASLSFKETIKNTLEPQLADLIRLCNGLISAIRIKLIERGYKDLVIFIEDLDKIPLRQAEKLFFDYASQLIQLRATVVYTFPISLYYNVRFGNIKGYFSDVIELPMIKLTHKDGTSYPEGIAAMAAIVHARINPALFETPDMLSLFISKSGGVIRDLFVLINNAAKLASVKGSASIGMEHFIYAWNVLKKEYNQTIADFNDDKGNLKYTAAQFYNTMVALIKSTDKQPDNSDMLMLLRQNLCVLSYNGEGWCDVHPAMKEVLRDRGYLN